MPKMHIKKDDKVKVIAGKYRGKEGKVLQVMPDERKLLVDGVNIVKKHTKPRPPKVPQGGILEKAMPVEASNVMLVCSQCSLPVRPKRANKARVCRRCNEEI